MLSGHYPVGHINGQQDTPQSNGEKQKSQSKKKRTFASSNMVSTGPDAALVSGAKSPIKTRHKKKKPTNLTEEQCPEWMTIDSLIKKKKKQLETKVLHQVTIRFIWS